MKPRAMWRKPMMMPRFAIHIPCSAVRRIWPRALRLRDGLRQYFTPGYVESARVAELVRRAVDFDFITTANEVEALVLENSLIKNYRSRFNILLKDDKNYLYLKLPVTEEFPRVHYSRRVQNDGALYFGPYTSAQV